jgi:hypothetical protein
MIRGLGGATSKTEFARAFFIPFFVEYFGKLGVPTPANVNFLVSSSQWVGI